MSVLQCILFTIIIDIIVISIMIFSKKRKKRTPISWCILMFSTFITIFFGINIINGYRHGMYNLNISFKDMMTHIKLSPVEDDLPSNLQQCIIIYYKFGCKDCEEIYIELQSSIEDTPNIYWVSTRSNQGKKLRELYPIDAVPTGVYIYNDSTSSAPHFIKKILYEYENTEQIHLNKTNLERLLELQNDCR